MVFKLSAKKFYTNIFLLCSWCQTCDHQRTKTGSVLLFRQTKISPHASVRRFSSCLDPLSSKCLHLLVWRDELFERRSVALWIMGKIMAAKYGLSSRWRGRMNSIIPPTLSVSLTEADDEAWNWNNVLVSTLNGACSWKHVEAFRVASWTSMKILSDFTDTSWIV